MKYLSCVFILSAFINFCNAQERSLNLFQILDTAVNNYPGLRAKDFQRKSSEELIKKARAGYIPQITAAHQYTYSTNNNITGTSWPNQGTAIAPSGGSRAVNIYDGVYGVHSSVLFDWRVLNFGKINANIKLNEAQAELSNAEYENDVFSHKIEVIDTYLKYLGSLELIEAAKHNLDRTKKFFEVSEAKALANLTSQVDVSAANAEYSLAKIILLQNEARASSHMLQLIRLMGIKADTLMIDSMNFYNPAPMLSGSKINIEESRDILLAKKDLAIKEAQSVVTRRSFYPTFSLVGAGWGRGSGISNIDNSYRTDFESGTDYQVFNYLVGAAFRWEVSSWFTIRPEYRSNELLIREGELRIKERTQEFEINVKNAEQQLKLKLEEVSMSMVRLKAAQLAFDQTKARYDNGLIDLPSYMQMLSSLNRSEADYYISLTDSWRALLVLASYAGDLDIFLSNVRR